MLGSRTARGAETVSGPRRRTPPANATNNTAATPTAATREGIHEPRRWVSGTMTPAPIEASVTSRTTGLGRSDATITT